MPMPSEMGVAFTGTQKADILTALSTAVNTLNSIKIVQLTPEERRAALSASEIRLPYIHKAIQLLAPQFPNLQPAFLPLGAATSDWEMSEDLRDIMTHITELNDRFTDFSLASEHFAYQYMRVFYNQAKQAQAVNTPGADTVVQELAPLFEGQGGNEGGNPTP